MLPCPPEETLCDGTGCDVVPWYGVVILVLLLAYGREPVEV